MSKEITKTEPVDKLEEIEERSGRGGWRGGGRPLGSKNKKTVKQEDAKDHLQKILLGKGNYDEMIKAYLSLAYGYYYEKPVWSNGEVVNVRIYKAPPDRSALNDLITRVIGKPIEEIAGSINLTNIRETQTFLQKLLKSKE